MFGMDVDGMKPGQTVVVDDSANGYPIRNLRDVPPGEYYVQAVLHRYETFHRSDGHTVKLPMDRGEGQHWNIAPGNLYSAPRKITLGSSAGPVAIVSIRKFRRFRRRRTPNTSATSRFRAPADQILGTPHVPRAPTCWCPRDSMRIPTLIFRSSSMKITLTPTSRLSHRAARSQPEAGLQ